MKIVRGVLVVLFCKLCLLQMWAQDVDKLRVRKTINQSTLVGVGGMLIRDTYLSPLDYNGTALSLLHERLNEKGRLWGKSMVIQQQFMLQTASATNPIGNATSYYGNAEYTLNSFLPLWSKQGFRIMGGAGAHFSLGGIYNIRNSNNPAQLKTSLNVNAAMLALYNWKKVAFRWQISTPLIGAFFSPEYGHSYYEMFVLGNKSGTIHLGNPFNQQGIKNYITADYPVGKFILRAGYLRDYYRSETNNLITLLSSHQFIIGMAFESLVFSKKEIENSNWLKSVYNE